MYKGNRTVLKLQIAIALALLAILVACDTSTTSSSGNALEPEQPTSIADTYVSLAVERGSGGNWASRGGDSAQNAEILAKNACGANCETKFTGDIRSHFAIAMCFKGALRKPFVGSSAPESSLEAAKDSAVAAAGAEDYTDCEIYHTY